MQINRKKIWAIVSSLFAPGSIQFFSGKYLLGLSLSLSLLLLFAIFVYTGMIFSFKALIPFVIFEITIYFFAILNSISLINKREILFKPLLLITYICVFTGIVALIDTTSPYYPRVTKTYSMQETLLPGDYFISDSKYYNKHPIKRSDVILHHDPKGSKAILINRVMGLQGDRIEIRDDSLFINGVLQIDSFAFFNPVAKDYFPYLRNVKPIVVPEGMVYLIGDNRYNCLDSRSHGPIEIKLVFGKLMYIYFSKDLSRIGKTIK